MNRSDVLSEAEKLITGDRADKYGSYWEQMRSVAIITGELTNNNVTMDPSDVSLLMIALKLRRLATSEQIDDAVDLAGYAALHAETFLKDRKD